MLLTEQHRITRIDPRWQALDAICFASKHLYNATLYQIRQAYLLQNTSHLPYAQLDKLMQPTAEYRALPAKVAQGVIKQVCDAWQGFLAAEAEYQRHPRRFSARPRLLRYRHKQGRNLVIFSAQAISQAKKNEGWIMPSGMDLRIATDIPQDRIAQVRIVPKATHYVVEVIYEQAADEQLLDPARIGAIAIGVNHLATLTANQPGFTPLLVNGRPLSSLTRWYQRRRTHLCAQLPTGQTTSRAVEALDDHWHRKVMDYLHTASRTLVNAVAGAGIQTLVIGKPEGWKPEAHMAKWQVEPWTEVVRAQLIHLLSYKAALLGIRIVLVSDTFTATCSFLDWEVLSGHTRSTGKRMTRSLWQTRTGLTINAAVNQSYNLLRKAFVLAFAAFPLSQMQRHPIMLALPDRPPAQLHIVPNASRNGIAADGVQPALP